MPGGQAHQAAAIHAEPNSAVTVLEPGADAVAGQSVPDGETLKAAGWGDIKYAVAIMIKPDTAILVLMHSHGAVGSGPEQAAPLDRFRRPTPANLFFETIVSQDPDSA